MKTSAIVKRQSLSLDQVKAVIICFTEDSADTTSFALGHLDMMTESLLHDNADTE